MIMLNQSRWPESIALRCSLEASQQIGGPNAESIGDGLQRAQGHALETSLQPVEVGTVQPGPVREFFLAPALFRPKFADPLAYRAVNVLQPSPD